MIPEGILIILLLVKGPDPAVATTSATPSPQSVSGSASPTTTQPTASPTTTQPTTHSPTSPPSSNPSTYNPSRFPTKGPSTSLPTTAPSTYSPSFSPKSLETVRPSCIPSTGKPTSHTPTLTPNTPSPSTRSPSISPVSYSPTRGPQSRRPTIKGQTLCPTTIAPTSTPTTVSPTTCSPSTVTPTWFTPGVPDLTDAVRVPLYACHPTARVIAWMPDRLEVIAVRDPTVTDREREDTCWRLLKHVECGDFPELCSEYERNRPYTEPQVFGVYGKGDDDVARRNIGGIDYVLGNHRISVKRFNGRVLVNAASWEYGQEWEVVADLDAGPHSLIYTAKQGEGGGPPVLMSKYKMLHNPEAECPPKVAKFARQLQTDVPLAIHGYDPFSCVQLSGAPHCFPFPVNATQRLKLGHICPQYPTHLFCELLPLWINNTFTYTARKVAVLDKCQQPQQRTSPGGYDVTIRMGDHGDGVEIRRQGVPGVSQGEFFLFRDVGRRFPLSLEALIVHIGKLALYQSPPPTPYPTVPPTLSIHPTMSPTSGVWFNCRPVRTPLESCPPHLPVAMYTNQTDPVEVIVCTCPLEHVPPSILSSGTTCGTLREYMECQQLPGCPLHPQLDLYKFEEEDENILELSNLLLGPNGITLNLMSGKRERRKTKEERAGPSSGKGDDGGDEEEKEELVQWVSFYSFSWSARSSIPSASKFGPPLSQGGTEVRTAEGRIRVGKNGLLWREYNDDKLRMTVSNNHCTMENLFSEVIPNPATAGTFKPSIKHPPLLSPLIALPSACLQGLDVCFPPPYNVNVTDKISEICQRDVDHYWCRIVRDWMRNVTSGASRVVNDGCDPYDSFKPLKISFGLGESLGIPVAGGRGGGNDPNEKRDVAIAHAISKGQYKDYWLRVEGLTYDGPGSPEYVRTTFQVLPVPSGPTRHPTPLFVSRSPVWRPSASPTRNPTRTNQTYTPTATTSPAVNKHFPTSSPTIAEVPYPPLDHLQAILPELKRMIQTIEPKEIIPEPSAYWYISHPKTYIVLMILLIVFGGGSCLGATAYVVKRFLIDKYILGPGAGYRRSAGEEEDDEFMAGIAMELDKFDSGPNMPAADGDVSLQQGGEGAVGGEGGEGGGGGDVKSRLSTSGTGVPDEKPGDDHDDDLDDYLENRRRSQMGSGMFGEVNLGPSSTPTIAAAAQTDNKGRVDPSGGFAPAAAAAAEAEAAVEVKLPVIVPPPRPPSPVNTEEDAANDVIQNLNLGGWERVGARRGSGPI